MSAEHSEEARAPSVPRATYRLQLNASFTFADAARVAPYLRDLGISHVYLSPILQATPGSTHGYDVVDHRRVSAELGGEDGYRAFSERLGELELGQVVDIVPNHMAIGSDNPWWWDVLENGPASRYAGYFDVDWSHPEPHLRSRVLLPILGDHYGRVLEAGELRLEWESEQFIVRYADHRMPVAPRSLDTLLALAAERSSSDELGFLGDAFGSLPPSTSTDPESIARRHRDKEVLIARLAALARAEPQIRQAIEAAVVVTSSDPDAMDRLLERQNYRLAWWRSARRDLGYRRFFDVTTLAGLRVEDESVFDDTHALVLDWLGRGVVDGVRVDHPDGLRDPESYFRRLRWASPRSWIVAEKILEPGEELRRSWPVDGTTGYDFLHRAQAVLLDPAGEEPLTELYARFTGEDAGWSAVAADAKRLVLRDVLGSELGRLTALLLDVLEGHRRHRDHTRHDLHEALRAVLVAFPIYRTYVRPAAADASAALVSQEDEAAIRAALDEATEARPDLPRDLFEVIGDLLLLRLRGEPEAEFVLRFQQLSGALMAKGIEDTALYRWVRLVALNEVGADAGGWAMTVDAFHAAGVAAAERWPQAMLSTSTHDTKRSGDVRARLLVLAEIPERWGAAVERWSTMLARHRSETGPDRPMEYLLYQTLVGAWPIDVERTVEYITKAMREAKTHTSWTQPDEAYEATVLTFARAALADDGFGADLESFISRVLRPGRINALAQTALKLTTPGIPDLYQGTDLWDLSLVDPDNRRPIDFDLRRRLLGEIAGCSPEDLAAALDDAGDPGRPKLALTRAALGLRARRPVSFAAGAGYRPLPVAGDGAGHAIAFTRAEDVAVIVTRLPAGLESRGGWGGTAVSLPPGDWRDALTGDAVTAGDVPLDTVLGRFPVALLERTR